MSFSTWLNRLDQKIFDYYVSSLFFGLLFPQLILVVYLLISDQFSVQLAWGTGTLWLQGLTLHSRNIWSLHTAAVTASSNAYQLYFITFLAAWLIPIAFWIALIEEGVSGDEFDFGYKLLAGSGMLYALLMIVAGARHLAMSTQTIHTRES
jgi:hypothetical protein